MLPVGKNLIEFIKEKPIEWFESSESGCKWTEYKVLVNDQDPSPDKNNEKALNEQQTDNLLPSKKPNEDVVIGQELYKKFRRSHSQSYRIWTDEDHLKVVEGILYMRFMLSK